MTPDLVIVTWNDACGSTTKVYDEARDHQATVMQTVGWLLKADHQGVSIACESYIEEGIAQWRGHTFIPLGMLIEVKRATTKGGRVIRKSGR